MEILPRDIQVDWLGLSQRNHDHNHYSNLQLQQLKHRHHQLSLLHKHQIQVVVEEELPMKTLMRKEESFWSETGLLLPDAGRNGKSGCSLWRKKRRT